MNVTKQAGDLVKGQSFNTLLHMERCYLLEVVARLVNEIPMAKDLMYLYISSQALLQGGSLGKLNDLDETNSRLVSINEMVDNLRAWTELMEKVR